MQKSNQFQSKEKTIGTKFNVVICFIGWNKKYLIFKNI